MPGGSSIGWGLEEFVPDTDWITAVHDLDQVAGKANVDLRIAISTNGRMEVGNQGMAVNNLQIADRSKVTLLEHFTNSSDATARMADDIVDAIAISHSKDVIDLQYHMAYPGIDMMNLNNPDPPSTRSGNYGVPRVPYIVLDGGAETDYRFDYSAMEGGSLRDHLRLASLEPPAFDIELSVNWMITGLEALATVTCLADRFDENVQLFMVVFEYEVTAYTGDNGDSHFRNVVLDMLPTPAGKLLGDNWRRGKPDTRINTWAYAPYVEDGKELALVAFLQDRNSGHILQAAVDYRDETVGIPVSIPPGRKTGSLSQSGRSVNLCEPGSQHSAPGRIELLEMSGRLVMSEQVPAGSGLYQMDMGTLTPGMYMIRWIDWEW